MGALNDLDGRRVLRAFARLGWSEVRVVGSHHILKKEGHPAVLTVPVHRGRTIKQGLMRGLLKAASLSEEEFLAQY